MKMHFKIATIVFNLHSYTFVPYSFNFTAILNFVIVRKIFHIHMCALYTDSNDIKLILLLAFYVNKIIAQLMT